MMTRLHDYLQSDYHEVICFFLIGLCNTAIHALIVVLLVEKQHLYPVLANLFAFFTANIFSFFANSKWTFRMSPTIKRYKSFLIASLTSLSLTIFFSGLAQMRGWHYLTGLALVVLCGPLFTFLILKFVTFKKTKSETAL